MAHTARGSRDLLADLFGGRVISLRTQTDWAPRFPDLTPLDFFLCGFIKEQVSKANPRCLESLKAEIRRGIRRVNQDKDLLRRVSGAMVHRWRKCVEIGGVHMEG